MLKAHSVLSEIDKCKSGSILCWLLFVMWWFGNEISGEVNALSHLKITYHLQKTKFTINLSKSKHEIKTFAEPFILAEPVELIYNCSCFTGLVLKHSTSSAVLYRVSYKASSLCQKSHIHGVAYVIQTSKCISLKIMHSGKK